MLFLCQIAQNDDDCKAFAIGSENPRTACWFGGVERNIGITAATNVSNIKCSDLSARTLTYTLNHFRKLVETLAYFYLIIILSINLKWNCAIENKDQKKNHKVHFITILLIRQTICSFPYFIVDDFCIPQIGGYR